MKPKMYRQGDVLLMEVESMPAAAEESELEGGRIILAHGEVTGHAHAVDATMARIFADRDVRFLQVGENGADLVHEEHATIALAPGVYRVVRQREYLPNSARFVLD